MSDDYHYGGGPDDRPRRSAPRARIAAGEGEPGGRFTLGIIDGKSWFTNVALDHETGRLSNEKLMAMSDEELMPLAYAHPAAKDGIRTEMYRRPRDGDDGGKTYQGICRAHCILEYRKAMDASSMTVYGKMVELAVTEQDIHATVQKAKFDLAVRPKILERIEKFAASRIREMLNAGAVHALSTHVD